MAFQQQKHERLQHVDLSRKGSVDEFIIDTVACLNSMSNYFTTSSCSGRIIILESSDTKGSPRISSKSVTVPNKIAKKGCKWILVSHHHISIEAVEEALLSVTNEAVFKFEPMIMHIQCKSLQDAKSLHQAAVASGFRNSGISVGNKGKIMMAVRSTHGLEVPLSLDGVVLVSKQYLSLLVDCANSKMDENLSRINRFMAEIKLLSGKQICDSSSVKQDDKCDTKAKKKRDINITNKPKMSSQSKEDVLEEEDLSLFLFENT